MKVRAILEFDLEEENGTPVILVERLQQAAGDTDHAIRHRLMGAGFLGGELLIGSWTLRTEVVAAAPSDPDPPP
ncbi:hypothetical protein [Rhizorhapis sp. SPR117]|uniref:hypothetical protein n=1 Tax=Rhizorhapis sp. SPR117 TaxID=2912611 RepID=UPI001F47CEAE|nr:hypothetical protein [Rhizorhapis sp. SPR117]